MTDLGDGYSLLSAPERDFGINYAIYRNVNPDFDELFDYGADLAGLNYCFWIVRDGEKIGGIIIRPNHIEGLFLRPPNVNGYDLLQRVLPLLVSWSDPAQPIEAVDVMPNELELYQRLGFRIHSGRRVYIRPTEPLDIDWPDGYEARGPLSTDVAEVAALFHMAYRDYPREHGLGSYAPQQWVARTQKRLSDVDWPEVCRAASTLLYDAAGRLAGACIIRTSRSIVRPEVGYANVADIGVHPEHRRRGLAAAMLRRALSALHGHYPVLKFGVAPGNPAEAFYYATGFLPGIVHHRLLLDPAGAV